MTPNLRKRHRAIWLLWAILLPILFVLAVFSIPESAIEEKNIPKLERIHLPPTPSDTTQS